MSEYFCEIFTDTKGLLPREARTFFRLIEVWNSDVECNEVNMEVHSSGCNMNDSDECSMADEKNDELSTEMRMMMTMMTYFKFRIILVLNNG